MYNGEKLKASLNTVFILSRLVFYSILILSRENKF